MEYYFFIIIVIIVLKILFWTFYFYVRAQRLRQARTPQRFIIVGAQPVRGRGNAYNDRSAIINHAEPVAATGPPPYAEVVKDTSGPLPPPYEQIASNSGPAAGTPANHTHSQQSGYPPQFSGQPATVSNVNEGQTPSAPVQQA